MCLGVYLFNPQSAIRNLQFFTPPVAGFGLATQACRKHSKSCRSRAVAVSDRGAIARNAEPVRIGRFDRLDHAVRRAGAMRSLYRADDADEALFTRISPTP